MAVLLCNRSCIQKTESGTFVTTLPATGNEIKRLLGEKGVNTDFIEVEDGISRINVKLRSNEESEINGQGPAITEDNIKKLYEKLDCLKESDVLVLAGSIPDVMPSSMYMDIMKHLEGRGINIVVDATRNLLTNVLPYKPFLIKQIGRASCRERV